VKVVRVILKARTAEEKFGKLCKTYRKGRIPDQTMRQEQQGIIEE
jgi:hypothetical protein